MYPLVKALDATPVIYTETWRKVQNCFWRPGYKLKWWGDAYYGSGWNALLPVIDEWRLARRIPENTDIVHFIWAEFASPSREHWFRRGHRRLIGTFHASARKLPDVIRGNYRALDYFDGITLMSETQKPFFLERGYPGEKIHVILHGVVTDYFRPAPRPALDDHAPLRGLLVGSTERDHAFMAEVMKKLPAGILELTVLTNRHQRERYYQDTPGVRFPAHLPDEQLLALYQQSDLLVMPMLDCTANNAVLESMACGTPVMVNRIGGISEYVDPGVNVIMEEKKVEDWVDMIIKLHGEKAALEARRGHVRAWAMQFAWSDMASHYRHFYGRM